MLISTVATAYSALLSQHLPSWVGSVPRSVVALTVTRWWSACASFLPSTPAAMTTASVAGDPHQTNHSLATPPSSDTVLLLGSRSGGHGGAHPGSLGSPVRLGEEDEEATATMMVTVLMVSAIMAIVWAAALLIRMRLHRGTKERKRWMTASGFESSEQDQMIGSADGESDDDEERRACPGPSSEERTLREEENRWIGRKVGDYVLGQCIARGLYGHVREAKHATSGALVAVKIVEKAKLRDIHHYEEPTIMSSVRHRNIARLLEVQETKAELYLVQEYLAGGELFHHMLQKHRLSEDEARVYWRQIVAAVAYLHCSGIAHRDLKPENVMFENKGGRRVKLIDFGLSCSIAPGRLLTNFCGSIDYAAPEVLERRPHDGRAADVYSLGVMLYTMVVGARPLTAKESFSSNDEHQAMETSAEFRDLIERIFQRDPRRRITIHGIMAHPWTDYCGTQRA